MTGAVSGQEVTGPRVVRVPDGSDPEDLDGLRAVLAAASVPLGRPVVVLVGGAAGMSADDARRSAALVGDVLVPAASAAGACLVDGGTDAGVMALLGRAWHARGTPGPLVGVAADGTLRTPDRTAGDGAPAEPHHTHLVVVPGGSWGDEVPWLAAVATVVAAGRPSVTVLANGGHVAYADVEASLDADRPVLVLAGTGRSADELAAVPDGDLPLPVEVVAGPAAFAAALARHLGPAAAG